MMKKMLLGTLYIISGILLAGILFLLSDVVLSRIPAHRIPPNPPTDTYTDIYLLSNGVHLDLVFPVKSSLIDWHTVFPYEHTLGQDSSKRWIAIGWGDKGFYLNTPEWKDLSLKTALVAGFGIGESALHITYYHQLKEGELCRKTSINREQYQMLINYVMASVEKDTYQNPIPIETTAQYGLDDTFYEAEGTYSLFYSCNTWTNNALKAARLPSATWTIFDKGILRYY